MKLKVGNVTTDSRSICLTHYTFTYSLTKYYKAGWFDIKVNGLCNFCLISLEPFFVYKLTSTE